MTRKGFIQQTLRVVYLTCAMMFCFAAGIFGSGLVNVGALTSTTSGASVDPWSAFGPVLVFSFSIALVYAYVITRSRWTGLKLAMAVFLSCYGLMTVVMQLESLMFLGGQIRGGMLSRLFLSGLITAGLFAPLAVLIMGKAKQQELMIDSRRHLEMPVSEWCWKIIVIGVCYVALYTVFGYYIAWKNPAIQAYYGGHDPGNIFTHVLLRWQNSPQLFLFQFGRGLLWMLFILPVIRMHRGGRIEIGMTIALLFAVWSLQLLIPNPMMPAEVTRIHLVETLSSNFIFGWIVGMLLA